MVFFKRATLLGVLVSAAELVVAGRPGAIVDLGYARYQGNVNTDLDITQFTNIRYAASPTGNLRWRPPQPPAPEPGVIQANTQPPECFQGPTGAAATSPFASTPFKKRESTQTEDCLFLKVDVPGTSWSTDPTKGLPVVVWIHGGGSVFGNASEFDGDDLILDAGGGVISVVIQYRLGLFGFLSGNEVKADGTPNAGIFDQTFALQWVQKYIHLFGGDPDRVTIWGESAGAAAVMQQIVAHSGKTDPPLFRGAITSSVAFHHQYFYNSTVPATYFSEVVAGTGCSNSRDVMACLRATDVTTLENLNIEIDGAAFFGTYGLNPVVDGSLVVESPTATLLSGVHNGDFLLTINNEFEGVIFTSNTTTAASTNLTLFIHELFPFLTAEHVDQAASLYATVPGSTFVKSFTLLGEETYICPSYLLTDTFTGASWKGTFAIPPALHEQDIPYYFNNPGSTPPFANVDFRKAFAGAFLTFVKTYNPNSNGKTIAPEWPMWSQSTTTEMLFNSTNGTGSSSLPDVRTIITDPALLKRCEFWRTVTLETGQ